MYKREKTIGPFYTNKQLCNQRPCGVAKNITFKIRRRAIINSCGFACARSLVLDKTFNLLECHISVLGTLFFVDVIGHNWLF